MERTPMTNAVIDQTIRDELLSVEQSFIVQAPAGSGKTELLTQRILALLAIVDKPENILAITFTRKAAAEMKGRVVSALQLGQQAEPTAAHEKKRWLLAQKVLARDTELAWRLIENPNRLNITTIDSLCANLSSALPLISQTGALPTISDDPQIYYEKATDNLLASIGDNDVVAENIKTLLRHKDNDLNKVSLLIAELLSKRLQWFEQIKNHAREFNQDQLSQSLKIIVSEKLQQLFQSLPSNIVAELPDLLQQAAHVLAKKGDNKKQNLVGLAKTEIAAIALPDYQDIALWKAIAELFLKAQPKAEILKSFTKASGFPTKKDGETAEQAIQFEQNKKRVSEIAVELAALPKIAELLNEVKILPDEIDETFSQQSLQAVVSLLPIAAAHLKLVFSQYNVIDFSELSLASLDALGHEDLPSDLALSLDYRLEHILVDEFQDTSSPQVKLLKLLTAGWQSDSRKTLFLVGDPMQSIYRFRDANVSLFMQICEQGIGDIKPQFRQLKVNFRSSEKVVDWVNQQFSHIMPAHDDRQFSAVSYAHSKAFNQFDPNSQNDKDFGVETILCLDSDDNQSQAHAMLNVINMHLTENKTIQIESESNSVQAKLKTLAILARSRPHFEEIIQLLNQHKINYQAVEIDRLSKKMVVNDISHLAFALTDQYDELSWCACMRSPWFGLTLDEVRLVMTVTDNNRSMPNRIADATEHFSEASKERCKKILPLLIQTIGFKSQKNFAQWLLGCFTALGGLAQLDFDSDLDDLNACIEKLAELSDGGELNDRKQIQESINKLFAAANPQADQQIQVMTIHKSKGLEFDRVILPRLDAGKRPPDQPLLSWTEVLDKQGQAHNLLAISKEVGKNNDLIYQYIAYLDKQKALYEDQRLLYVAATRAKQKLYLFGNICSEPKDGSCLYKRPVSSSFLSMLWDNMSFNNQNVSEQRSTTSEKYSPYQIIDAKLKGYAEKNQHTDFNLYLSRFIKKVNLNCVSAIPESDNKKTLLIESNQAINDNSQNVHYNRELEKRAAIGTVLHRQLQWISLHYSNQFELSENWRELTFSQLAAYDVFNDDESRDKAVDIILQGINNTLNDNFGQQILSATESAESELVLHKKLEHGSFLTRIIDRTFISEGKRWIIDYKSSSPEPNQSLEDFLTQEKALYQEQIEDYFKMFLQLEDKPTIAGLYFPLLKHFEPVLSN
jgi:ATP-dependent helicase/nuclease subunit A